MDLGQMNGLPILVIIAVIIYLAMRKTNKPEDIQKAREQKQETPVEPRIKDPVQPPSQIAWVSTNSRLPELYKEVTIFTTDKETLHGWARVNDWDYIHSKDDRTINNVSHWLDIGSPTIEPPVEPRIKDTAHPPSQIASNKPRMPR